MAIICTENDYGISGILIFKLSKGNSEQSGSITLSTAADMLKTHNTCT